MRKDEDGFDHTSFSKGYWTRAEFPDVCYCKHLRCTWEVNKDCPCILLFPISSPDSSALESVDHCHGLRQSYPRLESSSGASTSISSASLINTSSCSLSKVISIWGNFYKLQQSNMPQHIQCFHPAIESLNYCVTTVDRNFWRFDLVDR